LLGKRLQPFNCIRRQQTRLSLSVNEELLNERGLNGFMHSDDVYGSDGQGGGAGAEYMDPNTFVSDICVQVGHDV
jgi:hypothetical protein